MTERRICIAQIIGAHGVRGEAKIRCFTSDEASIAAYGPLTTEDGARRFTFKFLRAPKPGVAIVRAPEIASREDVEALAGLRLYAPRSALPRLASDDEFYVEDLIGLEARTDSGRDLGRISAVHNFGAGDVLEIKQGKATLLVPFTMSAAPGVDLAAGLVTIAEEALEEIDASGPGSDDSFEGDAMREEDS